jgi:hypothetical protein
VRITADAWRFPNRRTRQQSASLVSGTLRFDVRAAADLRSLRALVLRFSCQRNRGDRQRRLTRETAVVARGFSVASAQVLAVTLREDHG